jgi:hypothetical protein
LRTKQKNTTDYIILVKLAPAPIQIWEIPIFQLCFYAESFEITPSPRRQKHTNTCRTPVSTLTELGELTKISPIYVGCQSPRKALSNTERKGKENKRNSCEALPDSEGRSTQNRQNKHTTQKRQNNRSQVN